MQQVDCQTEDGARLVARHVLVEQRLKPQRSASMLQISLGRESLASIQKPSTGIGSSPLSTQPSISPRRCSAALLVIL